MSFDSTAALIAKEMESGGISMDEAKARSFAIYLSELKRWNSKHNLIGLRDDIQIIRRLFLSSANFLNLLPQSIPLSIADIGSGAGFPGIPLKILRPDIGLTCIDSNKKKVVFLRHIARILSLDVSSIAIRAEEIIDYGKYDCVVAHSVSSIGLLVDLSFPLLKEGGLLITRKGDELEGELKEIALDPSEYAVNERIELSPQGEERYSIVSIKKCST